jgi:hypothetical protein
MKLKEGVFQPCAGRTVIETLLSGRKELLTSANHHR